MAFSRSESQRIFDESASRMLAHENEFELRRRRLAGPAPDQMSLWPQLVELGILNIGFDEANGGFGEGWRDVAVIMARAGEFLAIEPLWAAYVCARVFKHAEIGAFDDVIARMIAGEGVFAFAHAEGVDPLAPLSTRADKADGGYVVSGVKPVVRHGDLAHAFVVSAALESEPAFFLAAADAPGLAREGFRLIDTSSGARITLSTTPARLIARGEACLRDVVGAALIGLSAEVSGICDAASRETFAYLKTRKQFGSPLAAFQALQHRAADMHMAAEELRAFCDAALDALDGEAPDASRIACLLKAMADDAGRKVGHDAVQLHGGMGVSDELVISHYMKRLAAIRAELGSADALRLRALIHDEERR